MITVYSKRDVFFQAMLRYRLVTIATALFLVLVCPHVIFGNDDITRRFSALQSQYKVIKTVYVKSQIIKNDFSSRIQNPTSKTVKTNKMTYEYWADDQKHYKGHSFFAASENDPEDDVEFAVNGKLWQHFDKTAGYFTYNTEEFTALPPALENPLFLPLAFLSREDNYPACVLKLEEVLNNEIWSKKLANVKVVTVPDQTPGQIVVEIPGGIQVLVEKKFVYHVYFSEEPDFLPAKISWVDETGRTFKVLEFVYNIIELDGRKTYWPQIVRGIVMWPPIATAENVTADFNVKTEFLKINQGLPSNIFTLDISSAETIYDDNLKIFIKQKGGF